MIPQPNSEKVPSALERTTVKYYVLCVNEIQFRKWVLGNGKKLQDCKMLSVEADTRGLDFTSPAKELIVCQDWMDRFPKSREWCEAGMRLIALYCRDRRVHSVPCAIVSLLVFCGLLLSGCSGGVRDLRDPGYGGVVPKESL